MNFYGLLSNEAGCKVNKITTWDDLKMELVEGTQEEILQEAREEGFKYVHLFEEYDDDYQNTHYKYVASKIVS